MEWFRWYHGGVSDDKWPLIARKSGQSVAVVVAVWVALLECASQDEERGSISNFDPESADASLGLEDGTCQKVIEALSSGKRPRIVGGEIANWSKRQPLRERDDDKSTERVRQHRERQKALQDKVNGQCNADETPVKRHETPRSEQNREEKKEDPIPTGSTSTEGDARAPVCAEEDVEPPIVDPEILPAADPAPVLTEWAPGTEPPPEDEPGIEFVELRELYDRLGRPEGPTSGFIEYKSARKSRTWPGISRITQAIIDFSEAGAWNPGYAPGLGRFLREQWWNRDPATLPARASPAGQNASPAPKTYAQAQDMEKRQRALRVLQDMESEHGDIHDNQAGVGQAGRALAAAHP